MVDFTKFTDAAVAGASPSSAPLAVRLAAETSPDQAAQANALARRYGIPAALAETFAEDYKARALTEDARATFEKSPRLGSWIAAQPDRAKVAHDDFETLGGIDAAIRTLKNVPSAIASAFPRVGSGLYGAAAAPFEVAGQGFRVAEDAIASMFGAPAGMGTNVGEAVGGFLRNEQQAAKAVSDGIYTAPKDAGIIERGVGSGMQSATQTLLTLPIALRQGGENAALGVLGIITGGEAYGKARDKGVAPAAAAVYGTEDAVAEVVTERLPFAKLLGDIKAGTGGAKMLVNNLLREVPGELAATVWQNFNEWANLNPGKSVAQWLGEQPEALAETVVATLVGGGAQVGAIKTVQAGMDRLGGRAQRAEQDAAGLDALAKLAEASKLRGRDAETFREFVAQVADEQDDAPTEFYIDGQTLANSLNQSGVTMQELEALAPVVAAQLDAAATGGDIRIPVSEFLSAGEAITAPLIDHLRTAPDAMSRAEAQEYIKTEGDRVSAEVERELQSRVDRDEFRKEIEGVRVEFQNELDKTKRFTSDVNKAYSELLANFYGATAARLGVKPQELLQKYRLRVQAQAEVGERMLSQGDVLDLGDIDSLMTQPDMGGVQDNASGESAASLEAQSRVASEKAQGRTRMMLDVATGRATPLVGVDAVDTQAGQGKVIVQRGVGSGGWTVLSVGDGVMRNAVMAAVGRGRAQGVLNQDVAEYQGTHKPPGPDSAALHDLTKNGVYPDDVYGPNGARWYGDGSGRDAAAFGIAWRLRGKPNASVTIYRAVPYEKSSAEKLAEIEKQISKYMARRLLPAGVDMADEVQWYEATIAERDRLRSEPETTKKDTVKINAGDWVTLTRNYASEHGQSALGGNYKIISKTVKAGELFTNGDSIQEWGYWPENTYNQDERPAAIPGAVPRAQISLPQSFEAGPAVISLLAGADLSSFLHESGHLFLEIQSDLATKIQQQIDSGASVTEGERAIVADMNRLLEWFGVKGDENLPPLQAWAMMSLDEKRQYHEQFARGFEAFAFEGKSPSIELQGIFQRFRSWLMQVYKTLRNLNVELTDDVRGVMGRMIASDMAIEEAEAQRAMGPLFRDAEKSGMTLEEFNAYQALASGATEAAVDQLQTRGLADMKWLGRARDKALKARQQEVEALRRDVRQEVRSEVLSEPVYRAWQFLTTKGDEGDTARGEKRAKSDSVDRDRDNLFTAIAKLGGMRREDLASKWGVDLADMKAMQSGVFGAPVARKEGGLSIDSMMEALVEEGYILPDEYGKADVADFEAKFDAQRRGEDQYSVWRDMGGPTVQALGEDKIAGKLNTSALREQYGAGEQAVWRKLSARRMTSDAGISPDIVAETFGFDSGDALVKALADAVPPGEVIEARTDQRMLEMFGDITSQQALERAADEAVHNEARARFIAAELKALQAANEVRSDTGKRTKQGRKVTTDVLARAAKDYAQEIIGRQRVRDLRPAQYASAEARSAKLAEKTFAAGKLEEAAMHKRNQLVNHYAAKAAYEAQAEVKKHTDYFRKFDKRPASVDPGYLDQIDGMLERFDFKPVSLREVDRRKSLAAWYDEQVAMGNVPAIPDELLDEANRKSYKDMTMEELRGLRDAVRNIEHLGRLKNKLMLARDQRTFDAIAGEMAQTIRDNGGDPREVKLEGENGVKPWFDGLAAMHRKLSSYFRQMDGGRDDGPLYEYIGRAMNERGAWEDTQIEQATVKLRALYKPLTKMRGGITGARSKLFIPAINASLTRGGRLAVALNWGNADNRQRIMDGDKWSEAQVRAILSTLTSEELAFVNGVWEFIDSYWPEVAAKEKRITGVEPEKVKAEPFTVKSADGAEVAMRGGYYPLKYDTDRSDRADTQEAAQVAKEMMRGAMTRATTRRGHTKERLQEVKRAVRKDLNVITQHVTQVVHDLAWHEWLIDSNRLLRDDRVVDAIREHYGPKVLKTIRDGIAGIATADVVPQTDVDKALLLLRSNVSRATMGASLTTAFLQPFGLTQSMARIGAKHVLRGGARWAGDAARMDNTLAWIQDKSEFMRLRSKSFNRELREISGTVAGKSAAMRAVDGGLFWLMQKMQLVADIPTWIGQYEKSIAEGLDEAAAVAQADRAVIEAQGSGQTKDLAEVQRKHPMLTQFYSYFSVTLNLVAEKTATTDFKNPRAVAGWLGDMALLLVIPAILPAMLMDMARGGDDDDEEGDLAKKMAKWQLSYMLGMVVGLRETSGMLEGYDYAGPPVGRIVGDIGKAGKQTAQGELDEPAVLAYARLIGTAFGLPVTQVIRSYRGWKAWDEGDAPPQAVLFGPPPKD